MGPQVCATLAAVEAMGASKAQHNLVLPAHHVFLVSLFLSHLSLGVSFFFSLSLCFLSQCLCLSVIFLSVSLFVSVSLPFCLGLSVFLAL